MNRREFLKAAAAAPLLLNLPAGADDLIPWCASGDVSVGKARLAVGGLGSGDLQVEWSSGSSGGKVQGTRAVFRSDFTAQAPLDNLPSDSLINYRASIGKNQIDGTFRTPPRHADQTVTFLWGGDVVGQGWGIDPAHGGMLTFDSMAKEKPHFFIHCGDSIYADDPLPKTVEKRALTWKNVMTPAKSKVAENLTDFYGNYRYNFLDTHYREFFSQVPVIAQWDDHEVLNNWNPTEHTKLAEPASKAFAAYWPMRLQTNNLFYRKISYGPNLDVFVLDLRSHRAPNSENRQPKPSTETALLGRRQLDWLKQGLKSSSATWKVIAGEMPIAPLSPQYGLDSWANGDGPPLGRELELAELLSFGKNQRIQNLIWLAADVHYAAAYHFHPERAVWKDFLPFWEFIAGPLHAGTFAPTQAPDPTFGPKEVFLGVPRDLPPNRPPSDNLQFYGKMKVTRTHLEVSLHQRLGRQIYSVEIPSTAG